MKWVTQVRAVPAPAVREEFRVREPRNARSKQCTPAGFVIWVGWVSWLLRRAIPLVVRRWVGRHIESGTAARLAEGCGICAQTAVVRPIRRIIGGPQEALLSSAALNITLCSGGIKTSNRVTGGHEGCCDDPACLTSIRWVDQLRVRLKDGKTALRPPRAGGRWFECQRRLAAQPVGGVTQSSFT